MTIDLLNNRLWSLWDSYYSQSKNESLLAPKFMMDFPSNELLFVGINPSFTKAGFRQPLNGTKYENLEFNEFYKWSYARIQTRQDYIAMSNEISALSVKKYGYFIKMHEISDYCGVPFKHIDLLFYRMTSQKQMIRNLFVKKQPMKFAADQIKLSAQAIELTRPRCIIVANALASKLFKDVFKIEWDERQGYYHTLVGSAPTPVLMSSMLSGGALDVESFRRLKWHIKKACT